MRHAIYIPPFGELADPHAVVELAVAAERSGWDGLFLWDHVLRPPSDPQPIADPWIVLSAVAAATRRIRLGPMVTPLARRRPHKVARETVTLDHLSGGRLIFGVGLGVDSGGELARFGEVVDERERAARLYEALDLLLDLWTGAEVDHRGPHFEALGVRFLPRPVQRPRIPVWGAARGTNHRMGPLRRAARLDGLFPVDHTVEELAWMTETLRTLRGTLDGFDVAADVRADSTGHEVDALAQAGATWALWRMPVDVRVDDVMAFAARRPAGSSPG